jgi:hypothetical protein
MPQTVLLRAELTPALKVSPRQRVELQGGFRWTWVCLGKRERRVDKDHSEGFVRKKSHFGTKLRYR